MARKTRVEVAGGLYHVITRGNNRRRMFDATPDYEKFLSLLKKQKARLPFFLYAYCLMGNHVHLLIERQIDPVGRIMQCLLTGYSQYYNRRYARIGHLLQGRYKAILCQSDRYLIELVRYIHLNPVRAGIVDKPEDYQYSGHRAYLGLEPSEIVDVDSVLRHFGAKKAIARKLYEDFVAAGMKLGHQPEFYLADESRILGTDEFVDETIHRIGETRRDLHRDPVKVPDSFCAEALVEAVEKVCGISRAQFCCPRKTGAAVLAKEMLILVGRRLGASLKTLSEISGISSSAISRRHEAVKLKERGNKELSKLAARIEQQYLAALENRKSQA